MSTTDHEPCQHDRYFTVEVRAGQQPPTILRCIYPREEERNLYCRNFNKWIAGEMPCQCSKCRTVYAPRLWSRP